MISTEHGIEIDAPRELVWTVFADVERWPEWTASVEEVRAIDGTELEVGRRFGIDQPRFPHLTWEVTALEPGRSWTWRQHSPGATTTASHELVDVPGGRTRAQQRIEQRGPLGTVVGLVTRRLTRRYLELEAEGLKARAEADRVDAPST